jgi:hypothetical protein
MAPLIQYQSVVEPFVGSSAAPETITIDKWNGNQEVPRRLVLKPVSNAVLPTTHAQGAVNPPSLPGWKSIHPDFVLGRRRAQFQPQTEFGAVTEVPVMSWAPHFEDRVPGKSRLAWLQRTWICPHLPIPPVGSSFQAAWVKVNHLIFPGSGR